MKTLITIQGMLLDIRSKLATETMDTEQHTDFLQWLDEVIVRCNRSGPDFRILNHCS